MGLTQAGWARTYAQILRLADAVAVVLALAVGLYFADLNLESPLSGGEFLTGAGISYWVVSAIVLAVWSVLLEASGSRNSDVFAKGTAEFTRVFNATIVLFVLTSASSFLLRAEPSRLFLGLALLSGFVVLLLFRAWARRFLWRMRARGKMKTTISLLGTAAVNKKAMLTFEHAGMEGYRVARVIDLRADFFSKPDFVVSVTENHVMDEGESDMVLLTDSRLLSAQARDELSARFELLKKSFAIWANPEDLATARMRLRLESDSPLIRVRDVQLGALAALYKRTFDFVVAFAALFFLAPVFAVIAGLVRLDSSGPALFRQTRVGQFGEEFTIFKFRTMVEDAEVMRRELEQEETDAGNAILFKLKADPRITRMGRLLRASSLDELPQLINVALGNMSLVGPRPPLPSEVSTYDGQAHRRLAAKPGITGLWQVSGRSDLSWEESVKLDLQYVENWSPISDMLILLRTVPAVVRGKGAY